MIGLSRNQRSYNPEMSGRNAPKYANIGFFYATCVSSSDQVCLQNNSDRPMGRPEICHEQHVILVEIRNIRFYVKNRNSFLVWWRIFLNTKIATEDISSGQTLHTDIAV